MIDPIAERPSSVRAPHRIAVRLLPEGLGASVFAAAVTAVAFVAANNLLYLVAATLVGGVLTAAIAAWYNVRGVVVRRVPPAEVYAGHPARGRYVVRSDRSRSALRIGEEGLDVGADADVEPGEVVVSARWLLPRRGVVGLEIIRVRSRFPFGLFEAELRVVEPGELLVWPAPRSGTLPEERDVTVVGGLAPDPAEVEALRPYRPGDAPRDIHWPTTARTGTPIVAVRRAAVEPAWIVIADVRGSRLEDALGVAVELLTDAWLAGRPVGLRLFDRAWPPRTGATWRRQLLDALARAEAP